MEKERASEKRTTLTTILGDKIVATVTRNTNPQLIEAFVTTSQSKRSTPSSQSHQVSRNAINKATNSRAKNSNLIVGNYHELRANSPSLAADMKSPLDERVTKQENHYGGGHIQHNYNGPVYFASPLSPYQTSYLREQIDPMLSAPTRIDQAFKIQPPSQPKPSFSTSYPSRQNTLVSSDFQHRSISKNNLAFENPRESTFPDPFEDEKTISTEQQGMSFIEKVVRAGKLTIDKTKYYNVPSIQSSQEKRRHALVPEDRETDVDTGNKSRWQILQAMHAYFDAPISEEFKGQALIDAHDYRVLKGEGGVGKTVLAKRFAEECWHKGDYQLIRWIDASDNLDNQFSLFLKEVFGIDEQLLATKHTELDVVTSVYASLAKIDRWLLIFDNVENAEVIDAYKPDKYAERFVFSQTNTTPRRHCLVTSRHPNWERTHVTKVGGFTQKEIQGYARHYFDESEYTNEALEQLAREMQFHPLGLIQAIHYLANYYRNKDGSLLPIAHYLQRLEAMPEPMISNHYLTPNEYGWDRYASNTLKAISLSIQLLIETAAFKQISASLSSILMQHVLRCLAYVQRTDVPTELIYAITSCLGELPDHHQADQIAKDIIQTLVTYKIIDCDHTYERMTIHQLMQRSLQFKQFEDTTGESFALLLEVLNNRFDYEPEKLITLKGKNYRRWILQIETLLEQIPALFQEQDLIRTQIMSLQIKLGQYFVFETRNYTRGRYWLERAEIHCKHQMEPEETRLFKAKTYGALTLAYAKQGLIEEGREYNKKSLALWGGFLEKSSHVLLAEAIIQKLELDLVEGVKAEKLLPLLIPCIAYLADYSGDRFTLMYVQVFIRAQCLGTQLYLHQNQASEALGCIEQMESLVRDVLPENHHLAITLLDYRIQVYEQSSQLESMKIYSQRAISLADHHIDLWSIEQRYLYRNRLVARGHTELAQQVSQTIRDRFSQHQKLLKQQNHRGWSVLHVAAYYKDIQTVQWLLVQGCLIDESNNFRESTPLHLAAHEGESEIVALFIEKGAKVNHQNKGGWTPLNIAADKGFEAICALLLDKGAAIDQANNGGWTSLNIAADKGHEAICALLLDKGAAIDQANNGGWTPLNSAANKGHGAICALLLDKGAAIDQANNGGWTPLNIAADKGHDAICALLLANGALVNQANNDGWTPLNSAADEGHEAICALLLANGALVNQVNKYGSAPLNSAANNGHEAVCRLLLAHGALVNQANNDGWTPLAIAVLKGHGAVCKVLLENKAELETVYSNLNLTVLHLAIQGGHTAITKLLVDQGANPQARDKTGTQTPLLLATIMGHTEVMALLEEKGATLSAADKTVISTLHAQMPASETDNSLFLQSLMAKESPEAQRMFAALAEGNVAMAQQCLDEGVSVDLVNPISGASALLQAVFFGYIELAKLLIERGANVKAVDKINNTILLAAVDKGAVEIVSLLLEKGADVNQANNDGWTPLAIAVLRGHGAVCKILLENKAELETVYSNLNFTVLHLAIQGGHTAITKLLVDQGANPQARDKTGTQTPLLLATIMGHTEVMALLEEKGATLSAADKTVISTLHAQMPASETDNSLFLQSLIAKESPEAQRMLVALAEGNVAMAQQCLDEGVSVDLVNPISGASALLQAVFFGYIELAKLLIERGANIKAVDKVSNTILLVAVEKGAVKIVSLLLEKGVDVNQANNDDWTPLNRAANNGHEAICALLLDKGAAIDQANNGGWTPLNSAVNNGHEAVCRLLLAHGALVDQANNDGWTPLAIAADEGFETICALLLDKGAAIDQANNGGWTPLNSAANKGHEAVCRLLLAHGALVDQANNDGWTPLAIAVLKGYGAVCKVLLENKAALETVYGNLNFTVLHLATQGGHTAIAKLLLDQGANPQARDKTGTQTSLLLATIMGHTEVMALLEEKGATLSATEKALVSALHAQMPALETDNSLFLQSLMAKESPEAQRMLVALAEGNVAMVQQCLDEGVSVDLADPISGASALLQAVFFGYIELAKLLIERGANIKAVDKVNNTILLVAVEKGAVAIVSLLLEKGVDVNQANNDGWTPLNSAANNGHEAVCRLLLAHGALVDQANNDGWTPLNSAADEGFEAICALLLSNGALVNQVNKYGSTPLNSAANNGHEAVCRLLLDHNADASHVDEDGLTAIHYTSWNRHIGCVKLLSDRIEVNVKGDEGITPLQLAVLDGCSLEVILHLVEKGANLTVQLQGLSIGTLAKLRGVKEQIEFFEKKGCIFNPEELRYCSPSKFIFREGAYQTLLTNFQANGGDLSLRGEDGETWLILALKTAQFEAVKTLLAMGADPYVKNAKGETLLSLAHIQEHEALIRLIEEREDRSNTFHHLQNANEVAANQQIALPDSENNSELYVDWYQACLTLFKHGYLFSLERSADFLNITFINEHIENETHQSLLERTRSSCRFFMMSALDLNVIDTTEKSFILTGDAEKLDMAQAFFTEVVDEIEISESSKNNIANNVCRVSFNRYSELTKLEQKESPDSVTLDSEPTKLEQKEIPDSVTLNSEQENCLTWLLKGIDLYHKELDEDKNEHSNLNEALEYFEMVLQQPQNDLNYQRALFYKAKILSLKEQPEDAMALLGVLLNNVKSAKMKACVLGAQGIILYNLQLYQEAFYSFQKAIKFDPDNQEIVQYSHLCIQSNEDLQNTDSTVIRETKAIL